MQPAGQTTSEKKQADGRDGECRAARPTAFGVYLLNKTHHVFVFYSEFRNLCPETEPSATVGLEFIPTFACADDEIWWALESREYDDPATINQGFVELPNDPPTHSVAYVFFMIKPIRRGKTNSDLTNRQPSSKKMSITREDDVTRQRRVRFARAKRLTFVVLGLDLAYSCRYINERGFLSVFTALTSGRDGAKAIWLRRVVFGNYLWSACDRFVCKCAGFGIAFQSRAWLSRILGVVHTEEIKW